MIIIVIGNNIEVDKYYRLLSVLILYTPSMKWICVILLGLLLVGCTSDKFDKSVEVPDGVNMISATGVLNGVYRGTALDQPWTLQGANTADSERLPFLSAQQRTGKYSFRVQGGPIKSSDDISNPKSTSLYTRRHQQGKIISSGQCVVHLGFVGSQRQSGKTLKTVAVAAARANSGAGLNILDAFKPEYESVVFCSKRGDPLNMSVNGRLFVYDFDAALYDKKITWFGYSVWVVDSKSRQTQSVASRHYRL